ncbi:MAG TPA: hypothetical protein VEV61_18900, partial [Streptosporangiaceae bacterium]|nr:hypothetical protein [Streptosporangiaceae bacterium]
MRSFLNLTGGQLPAIPTLDWARWDPLRISAAKYASVPPPLGTAGQHTSRRIVENELPRAHIEASRRFRRPVGKLHGPSEPSEPPPFKGQSVCCANSDSRCVQSLLNVHPEIDKITKYLHLALRLHVGTRNAERQSLSATQLHGRRDDGVWRSPPWRQILDMAG